MRTINLDGRQMDSRRQLHQHLREAFGFPDYYGNNLDALSDILSEQGEVLVRMRYSQAMLNSLGDYGQQVIAILQNHSRERCDFRFVMTDT